MRPAKPTGKPCPQGESRERCPLACKYNRFEADELTIDSWELKCLDCGLRETIGYRSDEREEGETTDPRRCPFCGLTDLPVGKNPCDHRCETP